MNASAYAALNVERCRGEAPAYCQAACPLHIDNRQMAALIGEGRFDEALAVVKERLPFPQCPGSNLYPPLRVGLQAKRCGRGRCHL